MGKGTPSYSAPEAFQDDMCLASDVWSLGVVLFEVFSSGAMPFVVAGTQSRRESVSRTGPAPFPFHCRVPTNVQCAT